MGMSPSKAKHKNLVMSESPKLGFGYSATIHRDPALSAIIAISRAARLHFLLHVPATGCKFMKTFGNLAAQRA